MRKLATFGALVVAAVLLGRWSVRPQIASTAAAAPSAGDRAPIAGAPDRELATLRAEVVRLQRSLDELAREQRQPQPAAAQQQEPDELARGESAALGPSEAYNAHVERVFRTEPKDPSWRAESELKPRFSALLPPGSVLLAFECGTSMCRVETSHPDMASYIEYQLEVFKRRPEDGGAWHGSVMHDVLNDPEADGEVKAVAYLVRDNHSLPANPADERPR